MYLHTYVDQSNCVNDKVQDAAFGKPTAFSRQPLQTGLRNNLARIQVTCPKSRSFVGGGCEMGPSALYMAGVNCQPGVKAGARNIKDDCKEKAGGWQPIPCCQPTKLAE